VLSIKDKIRSISDEDFERKIVVVIGDSALQLSGALKNLFTIAILVKYHCWDRSVL